MNAPVVGVVGAGAVGQSVAAGLVVSALPGRLLVVSRRPEHVQGLVADLQDLALSARSRSGAEAGEVADLHGCDAVVISVRTDFANTAARDVRRGGAVANTPALGALARELRGYRGTVLVVTNPVDLMARRFAEASGCPRVYGIGSNLDSARYRLLLARYAHVSPDLVHGHVIGEHGDRAVICVSTTTVNSRPVAVPVRSVVEDLQRRPALIRAGIGRTRYGPAGAVLSALRKALGLIDGVRGAVRPVRGRMARRPAGFHRRRGRPVAARAHPFRAAAPGLRGQQSPGRLRPTPYPFREDRIVITATRLEAATAAVTVLSNRDEVTGWALRYFGPWWNASPVDASAVCAEAVVVADVDPALYEEISLLVQDGRPTEAVDYAKHPMLVARDGEDIIATSPEEGTAYRSTPASGRLVVAGTEAQPLALTAARLAREAIRGQLLQEGWAVLHSSAVVRPRDGATLLTFGDKGAGKTTAALLLASHGWDLLANDRVLVRPTGERGVEVVPWPSAAALGLGLLHSLGWDVPARDHLRNGGSFHPTQHRAVTDALLAGDHTPLWETARRERKVQVFPDQFPGLFGVPLAVGGRAAGLLFPEVDADAAPDVVDGTRTLGEADFMSGATEDRYPDVFGQAGGVDGGGRESARVEVAARLAELPHRAVRLNHDVSASAAVLCKVADTI